MAKRSKQAKPKRSRRAGCMRIFLATAGVTLTIFFCAIFAGNSEEGAEPLTERIAQAPVENGDSPANVGADATATTAQTVSTIPATMVADTATPMPAPTETLARPTTPPPLLIDAGEEAAAFAVDTGPAPTSTELPADTETRGPDLVSRPISLPENPDRFNTAFWNIELNDADPQSIGQRIAAFDGVDLWGISEVNRPNTVAIFEAAAEAGEGSEFGSVLSNSGGGDRLLAIYDTNRFELIESKELDWINTTGNARAPLVLKLRERNTGIEFLFMVNHLYRSRDHERWEQARLLNEWAAGQNLPVIAGGDYNFDWATGGGDQNHDRGYDSLTANGVWEWVRPMELVTTQCSGWPCQYQSVLDFTFVAGPARGWQAKSEIVVVEGDFPDDNTTSDHRPVVATFWPGETGDDDVRAGPTIPLVEAVTGYVNRNANLRAGPGTNYENVGSATAGQSVEIVGQNEASDWYELDSGVWIASFLVNIGDTPPTSEPTAITVTPLPHTSTPEPIGSSNVIIQHIYYDGQVARVESDEYAVIANTGSAPANLAGWRLNADDGGQDYWFPSVELAPGQQVRVYTNEHHPESGGFSFGSGSAIWRNKGECGHLFNAGGVEVSTYCY